MTQPSSCIERAHRQLQYDPTGSRTHRNVKRQTAKIQNRHCGKHETKHENTVQFAQHQHQLLTESVNVIFHPYAWTISCTIGYFRLLLRVIRHTWNITF